MEKTQALRFKMAELTWAVKGFDLLQSAENLGELRVQNAPVMLGSNMVKIGRDYHGKPSLLIPAEDASMAMKESQRLTSGLSLSMATFPSDKGEIISYFVLASERSDVDDLFALMSQDICSNITENPESSRFSVIGDRIRSWQELLSKFADKEPSLSQQLGLLGELLTVDQLAKEIGQDALSSWFGPAGARHDFQAENWGLEVKSSLRVAKKVTRIHGLLQLEPSPVATLRLLLLQFERSLGGVTIEKLIRSIQHQFPAAKLDQALAEFIPSGLAELPSWTSSLEVKLIFGSVYVIEENFPRIKVSNLGEHKDRFSNIEYDLDLEGLPHISIPVDEVSLGAESW